ncbi:MAG TPA: hypothetical protein VK463_17565 [Desulfomonilaceae bacterium]|nr:hypothetical protein [Desulfomonilaceae bacterium]
MEALANFFESINRLLGVSGPGELIHHPVFIVICVVLFFYTLFTGMKYFAVGIAAVLGTSVIVHYLYPTDTSNLGDLLTFIAALGVMAIVLVYFGFIRE